MPHDQLDVERIAEIPQWYVLSASDTVVDEDEVYDFYSDVLAATE